MEEPVVTGRLVRTERINYLQDGYLPAPLVERPGLLEPEEYEATYDISVFGTGVAEELVTPCDSIVKRMGAKSQLAAWLVSHFPRRVQAYVEPFAGSFKVLLAKPFKNRIEIVNDLDQDLIHFFRYAVHDPGLLADYINSLPTHESLIIGYRMALGERRLRGLERAAAFYLMSRSTMNAVAVSGTNFGYASSVFQPINTKIDRAKLFKLAERLRDVNIRSTTVWRILAHAIKEVPDGVFFYLDPPYDETRGYEVAGGSDDSGFGKREQVRLAEHCALIDKSGNRFIQTNSATKFLIDLYGSFKRPDGSPLFYLTEREVYYSVSGTSETRAATKELIISNFPLEQRQRGMFS